MVCGQDVDGDSQFCENTEDLNILKEEKEGKIREELGGRWACRGCSALLPPELLLTKAVLWVTRKEKFLAVKSILGDL